MFESLLKHANHITVLESSFPALEAIFDAFKPLYEAAVLFEGTNYPKIHMELPNLYYCVKKLHRIADERLVHRSRYNEVAP